MVRTADRDGVIAPRLSSRPHSSVGAMSSEAVLKTVIPALEKAQIPFMVVGSFASNLYGTGRATQDIDLVISAAPEQIRIFLSALPPDYYADVNAALDAWRHKSMFNILDMEHGWKVDLIFEKPTSYHRLAFQRRVPAEIDSVSVFAATAEDVILAKLDWAKMGSSARQIEDVAGILKVQQEALDLPYIENWVAQLGLSEQWAAARKAAGLA